MTEEEVILNASNIKITRKQIKTLEKIYSKHKEARELILVKKGTKFHWKVLPRKPDQSSRSNLPMQSKPNISLAFDQETLCSIDLESQQSRASLLEEEDEIMKEQDVSIYEEL
jgi:hypothetical protein